MQSPSHPSPLPSPADDPLDAVLAEYLRRVDAGEEVDREAFVARHAEYAADLRSFFTHRDAMQQMAQSLAASDSARGSGSDMPTLAGETSSARGPRIRYFGDYELIEEIARGGMGIVYRARQVSLNRRVALKMILAGQLASDDAVKRFRQEAEAAAHLDHPGIVPIHEIGEHEGQHYFSMKLIEGTSLSAELKQKREQITPQRAAELIAAVARAVHHAHQRGVLHRDLKPGNILLDEAGQPHVTDFGLAKRVEGESDLTATGAIVGTPAYMAPEQASGGKQLTTAVDIYSLGAILYELLTGKPPFSGDSPMETLLRVIHSDPERPSAVRRSVDADLETIALKCLEKEPDRRYASAAALADDLDRWLRGEPIEARPVGVGERVWRWCQRNPAIASLATAAVMLLVVGTIVSTILAIEARDQADQAQLFAKQARDQWELTKQQANRANQEKLNAVNAQKRAEANELVALENNYRSSVIQAQHHYNLGEIGMMIETLETQLPERLGGRDFRRFEWHFLNRISHAYEHSLPGVEYSPYSILYSPNGAYLAVAGYQFVRVYDVKQKRVLFDLSENGLLGKIHGPQNLAFSPDSKFMTVADSATGENLKGKAPRGILVVSLPEGKLAATIPGFQFVAFSPDSSKLATLLPAPPREEPQEGAPPVDPKSLWQKVAIRSFPKGEVIREFPVHNAPISYLEFSPDGKRLGVNGAADGKSELWDGTETEIKAEGDNAKKTGIWARIWEIETGKPLLAYHELAEVKPTETYIVPRSQRQIAQEGRLVPFDGRESNWPVIPGGSWSADISFNYSLLAISGRNSEIHLYDYLKSRILRTYHGHTGRLHWVAFSPDNRHFATASFDSRGDYDVKIWDVEHEPMGQTFWFPINTSYPLQIVFPPSNECLIFEPGQKKGALFQARNLSTGERVAGFEESFLGEGGVMNAKLLPDGDTLAGEVRHANGPVHMTFWSLKNRRLLRSFPLPLPDFDGRYAFQPDYQMAVTPEVVDPEKASPKSKLVVWRLSDVTKVRSWATGVTRWVFPIAVSPDGKYVVCGGYFDQGNDSVLYLYDVEKGQLLHTWAHEGIVGPEIRFASGSDRVIAASAAGWRIWNTKSGRLIQAKKIPNTREGESRRDGPQAIAAISPDGTRLATTSSSHSFGDVRVLVWDIESGQQLLNMPAPLEYWSIQFSPDNQRLLIGGYDDNQNYLKVWDGSPLERKR